MKRELFILVAASLPLAACGQATPSSSANFATTSAAVTKKAHSYCFFKDEEMRAWKASRDAHGNITVDGEAHVKDPRYKAGFGKVEAGPKKAILLPTISQNDTGYASPGDWWHLGAVVPASASLSEAVVQCGDKTVADLKVAPKG